METITPEELLLVFEGKKRVPVNRIFMDTCALISYCPDVTQIIAGREWDASEYERLQKAIRRSRKIEASNDLLFEMQKWQRKLGHMGERSPEYADALLRLREITADIIEGLSRRNRLESQLAGTISYIVENIADKQEYRNEAPNLQDLGIAAHTLDRWLQNDSVALATADQGLGKAYVQAGAALREAGGENIQRRLRMKPILAYAGHHGEEGLEYDIINTGEAELATEIDKECAIQIQLIERKLE